MLPGATVPGSLDNLLAVFRPCFTAPTFQTFVGLLVGLIAQTRRRTACGMLTGAGLNQVWHHSRGRPTIHQRAHHDRKSAGPTAPSSPPSPDYYPLVAA